MHGFDVGILIAEPSEQRIECCADDIITVDKETARLFIKTGEEGTLIYV